MNSNQIAAIVLLAMCQIFPITQADQVADKVVAPAEATVAMPKLSIVWSCGECSQNEKVIPLIQKAYSDEVAKNGKVVSETESVEVAIISYRQRNPGARAMFGAMAGKDIIGLKFNHNGNESTVSDYSANAMQGMNYLCESVAKRVYRKISGTVK